RDDRQRLRRIPRGAQAPLPRPVDRGPRADHRHALDRGRLRRDLLVALPPIGPGRAMRVVILVENLPSPFDRRVWQEANALRYAGHAVTIICPTGKGYDARHEVIAGIEIHRYSLPVEAEGAAGSAIGYAMALAESLGR